MELKGTLTLFVNAKKTKEGSTFNTFSTSVGAKQDDNTYLNKSLDVLFTGEKFTKEVLAKLDSKKCYSLTLNEAWLSVRKYVNKDNAVVIVPVIVIKDATITGSKDVIKNSSEFPF